MAEESWQMNDIRARVQYVQDIDAILDKIINHLLFIFLYSFFAPLNRS